VELAQAPTRRQQLEFQLAQIPLISTGQRILQLHQIGTYHVAICIRLRTLLEPERFHPKP
jgi:hypothetical protein